jgi:hypothetical protein
VDKQYEQYCLADPLFYDSLQRRDQRTLFPAARRPLPRGWQRIPYGEWMIFRAPGPSIPSQGWKIHVSACPENALRTLTAVWEYCVSEGVTFKIISSP